MIDRKYIATGHTLRSDVPDILHREKIYHPLFSANNYDANRYKVETKYLVKQDGTEDKTVVTFNPIENQHFPNDWSAVQKQFFGLIRLRQGQNCIEDTRINFQPFNFELERIKLELIGTGSSQYFEISLKWRDLNEPGRSLPVPMVSKWFWIPPASP